MTASRDLATQGVMALDICLGFAGQLALGMAVGVSLGLTRSGPHLS